MPDDPLALSPAAMFEGYEHASLQQIARKWGMDIKSQPKAKMVKYLAERLGERTRIEDAFAELSSGERKALDILILLGGRASTGALRAMLEEEGIVDPPARTRYGASDQGTRNAGGRISGPKVDSRTFENIVARLGVLGLAYSAVTSGYKTNTHLGSPGTDVFIPAVVVKQLPKVSDPLQIAPAPDREETSDPTAIVRDAYVVLSEARTSPLTLLASAQLSKKTMVRLDGQFRVSENASQARSESDLGRLSLLRSLLQDQKLLVAGPSGLQAAKAAEVFLSTPRGNRLQQLFEAYGRTTEWSELGRLGIAVSPRANIYSSIVAEARGRVLRELAALPADEWIAIDHFVGRIRRYAFELLFSRSPQSSTYYWYGSTSTSVYPYGGSNALGLQFGAVTGDIDDRVTWDQVEGEFVRVMLREPLWWLGVVDFGVMDDGTAPTAFRITKTGADLLSGKTPTLPEAATNVVIQPNFQIFAFEPTGEDVLYGLDRLARRVRAEQVVEYHLSRESIYAAQRAGLETADAIAFLERVSSVPLPQNVRRSIEDWGAQHDRILLRRNVAIIHAVDEGTLSGLYHERELGKLLGRRPAPTVALVPKRNLKRVRTQLMQGGPRRNLPLPIESSGRLAHSGPVIEVETGGRIRFLERVPSIYVHRAISAFASTEADNAARLTPASLRHSARRGATPKDIVTRLESMSGVPLPPDVTAMIERWAHDWGRGAIAEVTVLQLESPDVTAAVAADPDISPHVTVIPGAATLLLIRRDRVSRVRKVLEERGVALEERFPL